MNRSNVGNVTTNAMQILSVGATTASKIIKNIKGNASSSLNAQTNNPYHGNDFQRDDYMNNQNQSKQKPLEITDKTLTADYIHDDIYQAMGIRRGIGEQQNQVSTKTNNDINWQLERNEKLDRGDIIYQKGSTKPNIDNDSNDNVIEMSDGFEGYKKRFYDRLKNQDRTKIFGGVK